MSGIQQLLLAGGGAAVPVDPYFYSVTSLLHGDGTNGGQNNTFLDSSSNNFTITRNGNTTQGSFSPFSQTGWSGYFDGSGDYCTLSSNASMDFGAGNFTIECFVNTGVFSISAGASRTIIGNSGNSYTMQLYIETGSGKVVFGNTGSTNLQGTGTVADNQWHHIVVVRSGTGSNQTALFIDGQRQAVGTNSQNYSSGTIYLGAFDTGNGFWNGYISNLRIVKGTAVYDPTATTLTVPTTPLTAVSNTALLTLQSNRFLDNSTNAYTVTKAGDTSIQPFSPFNPTTAYSTGSIGGSGYFDGSGDYVSAATASALQLTNAVAWTIEFWFYANAMSSQQFLLHGYDPNPPYTGYGIGLGTNGNPNTTLAFWDGTTWRTIATGLTPSQWYHVAISYEGSGTTGRMFLNGTQQGAAFAPASTINNTSNAIAWAAQNNNILHLNGYISGARIVKGTAVYTASFTAPTAPPTAITNTSLLLNFTNGAIFDNAAVADYETVGNAQISTSVKKYGTGSMSFDGTTDYLVTDAPSAQLMAFGTGDFTVEMWVYFNAIGTDIYHFYDSRPASTDGAYPTLRTNASAQIEYVANSAVRITGLTLTTNTWYHVALCRTASQTKLFVNGTQTGSTYADTTNYLNAAARPLIGGSGFHVTTLSLSGYVDDVRISKGIARYTYNFTPPTAEFPNIGGTVTLTADPYFDYTTLLLPGNGTNGAQNNTFLDSSTNAFSITRNGNTTQGTFSPFSQTGWGNYFPGTSGSYLSFANNSALNIGSGDFTAECWIYPTAKNNSTIFYKGPVTGPTYDYFLGWDGATLTIVYGGTTSATMTDTTQLNSWNHIALVRNTANNTIRVYINGTQAFSATYTGTYASTSGGAIGGTPGLSNTYAFSGYISNVRFGQSAVYTSNFTPSTTPLTAITNTSLLTCQSNRFIDNSTNAFAITRNGDVSVQAFSPFNPTAAWSAATNGGSGYFDGSGDFLTLASNTALDMGTGNFTVEMWVYSTDASLDTQNRRFFATEANGSGSIQLGHVTTTTGVAQYCDNGSLGALITGTTNILNQWAHIAAVRSGTTVTLYVNGVSEGTATDSGNKTSTAFTIGKYPGASGHLKGWLGSLRVVKGTAVYTGTFTPPTSPLTAISGTSLLLNYTNAGIYDATSKNDLETVGNAQISTTQSKFGGSSMYFDGTGDGLIGPSTQLASFGTGDFTIESWVYLTTISGADRYLFTTGNGIDTSLKLYIGSTGEIVIFTSFGTRLSSTNPLVVNTWTHVAVRRYNGTLAVYLNGVQNGTASYSTAIDCNGNISVGSDNNGGSSMIGYLDDFRVTKGIARYTSNFTPPTTAFLTL